jgi:predicted nuclease of predicted toxin-antitoxin system
VIRFAADQNLNNNIVRGVRRRNPLIDIVRLEEAGLSRADDSAVLEWAAREKRILLTHDVTTITRYAMERLRAGQAMSGVFEISIAAAIREVIDDILLLAELSEADEWAGQIRYLPLRD